jgi:hypothetical protein
MGAWLYNPKDDYKGRIFWDDEEYRQAVADGWQDNPFPKPPVVEIAPKVEEIVVKAPEKRKPGRKKGV